MAQEELWYLSLIDVGRRIQARELSSVEVTTPRRATRASGSPRRMRGSPALTLPGGFTAEGVPVGFQLIGPHFEEALLLQAGCAFQQATEWHLQRPPLAAA
ncbi:MAG TPA: hypothetical protein VFG60_07090 [Burkholderiaceae bacterium]|nr:hypothetical protein [Burkholderiaceae bacterium]